MPSENFAEGASFEDLCNEGLVRLAAIIKRHPRCKQYSDEMFSAGSLTLVEVLRKLEGVGGTARKNWKYVSTYLIRSVANVPNDLQVIPSRRGDRGPKVSRDVSKLHAPEFPTETFETILDRCHDDLDRDIVNLRISGLTDHEIAIELNQTYSKINKKRKALYGRYVDSSET